MTVLCSDKRQATRKALLSATRDLVFEKEHNCFPVQEITERAGVSTGTFYNYFEFKQDVFVAVAEDMCEELSAALAETRANIKDPAMVVAVTLKFYFEQAISNQDWREFIDLAGLTVTLQQQPEQCLEDIERGVKAGRFRVDDVHFTQNLVTGMVRHITEEILNGRIENSGIEYTIRSVLQMLGLPELVSKALTQTPLPAIAMPKRNRPPIRTLSETISLSGYEITENPASEAFS